MQILDVKWRVGQLLRAVEENRAWAPAEAGIAKIIVSRRDRRTLYRELEPIEYSAIEMATAGVTFAEICDVIATDADKFDAADADPVATLNRLLARWLGDGIFAR